MLPHCVYAPNKIILWSSSERYHMVSTATFIPKHSVLQIPHCTAGMISHLGMSLSGFKGMLCTISLIGGMVWINTITMNLVSWTAEGLVSHKQNFQLYTASFIYIKQYKNKNNKEMFGCLKFSRTTLKYIESRYLF